MLQDADTAMYLAKGRGKDRVEVFERGFTTGAAERSRVEQLLRTALSHLGRLHDGSMPCDGAWPPDRVEVFERWTVTQMQP